MSNIYSISDDVLLVRYIKNFLISTDHLIITNFSDSSIDNNYLSYLYQDAHIGISSYHIYSFFKLIKLSSLFLLNSCLDLIIYDNPNKKYRFTINYNLLSTVFNYRFNISIQANELISIPSLTLLYSSLIWSERECWDLFGIFFINNLDLRRILTDYGFKGHPLRRDFPLTGFYEILYNDLFQQIAYTRVELTQEFRPYSTYFNKKWD